MELPQPEPLEPPFKTLQDICGERVRGAIAVLTAGMAKEILETFFGPRYSKRLDDWRIEVANRILQLEKNGLTIEKLQSNEQFLSTLAQATQAAIRTHETEKIEALRNAVINSGLSQSEDKIQQQVFLSWIDNFTALHLRLLKFLQRPTGPPKRVVVGGDQILDRFDDAVPRPLRDAIADDLKRRKLTWVGSTRDNESQRHKTGYTTVLGDEFLDFIADPLPTAAARE